MKQKTFDEGCMAFWKQAQLKICPHLPDKQEYEPQVYNKIWELYTYNPQAVFTWFFSPA